MLTDCYLRQNNYLVRPLH